ncbi:hypothetical protein FHG66_00290 [Rubellimicrobium rubrum]|uniref:Uncharacterized protein n=1 Tax=Rubellimicrobium rubrum TaxID=2585369 RepID=A0A5C4N6V1_9RHOB|nr:hypothetical protein [Rubellimicrobium rubrum]TNC52771.1 hypothetical protein FHG66_00290 [Rubellimicrobium rubrum]
MTGNDPHDPKGLVREAYAIAGITASECRSIFLDWALSLPAGADAAPSVRVLLDRHGSPHPMTEVLRAALDTPATPRRRGGRSGRLG